jgi:RHS repeat-associated protein
MFTGQERDAANSDGNGRNGLDFFQARYFAGVTGRFMSVDPGNAGANPGDPQSWNGYAYVGNNPLTYTDPSGLFAEQVGLCAAGPEGCAIGAAIGIAEALFGIFGFGGGSQADLSSIAHTPVTLSPSVDWQHMPPTFSADAWCYGCLPTRTLTLPQTNWQFFRSYWSTAGFLFNFLTGTGPRIRYYGPADYRTRDLMSSKGFQQINQQIKEGCLAGKSNDTLNLSSWDGYKNIPYDSVHSPVGGQVGGYNGSWHTVGDTTYVNIVNYAGAYSFFYHGVNDRTGTKGPFRTIKQTFNIEEPNPCGAK